MQPFGREESVASDVVPITLEEQIGGFHCCEDLSSGGRMLAELQQRLTDEGGLMVEAVVALMDDVHAVGFGVHTA